MILAYYVTIHESSPSYVLMANKAISKFDSDGTSTLDVEMPTRLQ
jgi:hypothetical protein